MRGRRGGLLVAGLLAAGLVVGGVAHAQNGERSGGDFGLGVIVGDPTGLSGKYMLATEHAIDFAAGLGFLGGDHWHVHADYLWHMRVKKWPTTTLDVYLGAGPKLGIKDKKGTGAVLIGARGPVGISIGFLEAPFDVFVEVAAGLWIVDKVDLDVDAALGGRYWFM